MPNPFELARLKNIFGPSIMGNDLPQNGGMTGNLPIPSNMPIPGMGGPSVDLTQPMAQIPPSAMSHMNVQSAEPDFDAEAMMRKLYTPQTGASDRFDAATQAYPEYEKPGFWRSMAGALSAFGPGGHKVGMEVANFHNDRKMAKWKDTIGPLQSAANLERQENTNNRTLAHNTVQNELSNRRIQSTAKTAAANTAVRQQSNDIRDFKARHPDLKFITTGPKIQVFNPADGSIKETEWSTGNLTESEKIELNQKNAIARIGATGTQTRLTDDGRQIDRVQLAETRGWDKVEVNDPDNPGQKKTILFNQITGESKDPKIPVSGMTNIGTPGAAGRGELPTQTKVRQASAAAQLKNSRPDLAKFIRETGTNEFEITPPATGTGFFDKAGPTNAQYEEIKAAIYGSAGPTISSAPRTDTTSGGGRGARPSAIPSTLQEQVQRKAPPGWEYVRRPGGGWTAVKKAVK